MKTKTFKVVKEFKEDNKWLDANSNLKKKWLEINEKYKSSIDNKNKKEMINYKSQLDKIGGEFYILNQGLAYNLAKTFFINNDNRTQDYLQAAALGLWEAFLKWDPINGANFSTFSRAYIKGRTQRAVRSDEYSHLTQNDFAKRRDVLVAKDILNKKLGREPSISEIAKYVKITEELTERIIYGSNISLFTKISEDGGTLEDLISEKEEKNDALSSIYDSVEVDSIIDELSELEFWVMTQKLESLGGDHSRSLLEIGEDIGVGREIARRAETKARTTLAFHYLVSKLERFPTQEELSVLTGIDVSKLSTNTKLSFYDLHSRYLRKRINNVFDKNKWVYFGIDFVLSIYNYYFDIIKYKSETQPIDKKDKELLLLFFFDAFISWNGNEDITFSSYIRKKIESQFTKNIRNVEDTKNEYNYEEILQLWDIIFQNRLVKRKVSTL